MERELCFLDEHLLLGERLAHGIAVHENDSARREGIGTSHAVRRVGCGLEEDVGGSRSPATGLCDVVGGVGAGEEGDVARRVYLAENEHAAGVGRHHEPVAVAEQRGRRGVIEPLALNGEGQAGKADALRGEVLPAGEGKRARPVGCGFGCDQQLHVGARSRFGHAAALGGAGNAGLLPRAAPFEIGAGQQSVVAKPPRHRDEVAHSRRAYRDGKRAGKRDAPEHQRRAGVGVGLSHEQAVSRREPRGGPFRAAEHPGGARSARDVPNGAEAAEVLRPGGERQHVGGGVSGPQVNGALLRHAAFHPDAVFS